MSVYPEGITVERGAIVSDDGCYRYRLTRRWNHSLRPLDGLPLPAQAQAWLPFVMLNPSTADAEIDDPTIRRCVGFARREGYGGIAVWNLYAYRTPSPKALSRAAKAGVHIEGPDNDRRLRNLLAWSAIAGIPVVAGWGTNADVERVDWLLDQPGARQLRCLGVTKDGHPRHPLYVPADAPLIRFGR